MNTMNTMSMRRITSLTALLAFIIMVLTSIILYIVPQGRVAYWADWHLWGLTKEQWGSIHINTGLLFLISLGLHLYYNWKPIMRYLKSKTKQFKLFTKEFNVALVLVLAFVFGTFFGIPPFSSFLELGESIKDAAAEKYGEPPYGHAELSSVKTFSKRMGIDSGRGLEELRKVGYKVENEMQTLAQIGRMNNISPQQVYETMKPALIAKMTVKSGSTELPDSPPAGMGKLTLADMCSQFNLNIKEVVRELGKRDIKAKDEQTIKKIAEANKVGPIDIYEHMKAIASEKASSNAVQKENVSRQAKSGGSEGGGTEAGGTGYGRMTLAELCRNNSIPEDQALHRLADKGINADPNDKLREIASAHGTSPLNIVEIIQAGSKS